MNHRNMDKRILIHQGHPDPDQRHFNHALADAYAEGARAAGHAVQSIDVATLDFALLRSKIEWESGALPKGLLQAQQAIRWAEHLTLFFPLWLGGMPALLKGFLEQWRGPASRSPHPPTKARRRSCWPDVRPGWS